MNEQPKKGKLTPEEFMKELDKMLESKGIKVVNPPENWTMVWMPGMIRFEAWDEEEKK